MASEKVRRQILASQIKEETRKLYQSDLEVLVGTKATELMRDSLGGVPGHYKVFAKPLHDSEQYDL